MPNILHYLLGALVCVILSSCSVFNIKTPRPEKPHKPPITKPANNTERIFVFSHGWHTGIVIPTHALRRHPWTHDLAMNQTPYAEFGWGDEEFYRRKDLTSGMIVRGLFWPTAAVVHLERFQETPYQHYPASQLVTLELKRSQVDAVINKLYLSFSTHTDGSLINLGHGAEADSTYFRSRFKYYYPETCNIWTSRILNAAGLAIKESTRSPELMKNLRKSNYLVH